MLAKELLKNATNALAFSKFIAHLPIDNLFPIIKQFELYALANKLFTHKFFASPVAVANIRPESNDTELGFVNA